MTTSFWRKVSWLTAGEGAIRVGQVVTVVLLVRWLDTSSWNVVALALTIFLAAVTVGSFNLQHSILYFLPGLERLEQDGLLKSTFFSLSAMGAVIGGVVLLYSFTTPLLASLGVAVPLSVAVACELPTVIVTPLLVLRAREVLAGIWEAIFAAAQFAATVVPALLGASAAGILGGVALISAVKLTAFVVLFARSVDTQARRATRTRFLEQLWFCVPLGVALAAGTLARVVDKWLVATWSPDQIGMYTVAAQEVPVLPVIPYAGGVAIAVSMVEAFRSGRIEKAHGLWFEQIRSVSRIVVPASFFLLVIAPVVIPNLFGSRYVAAVLPFQVFAVIGLHRVTEYGMVLRASGRTGDLVRSSIVLLGATLVLGVPAAAFGGIVGVSLSTLAAFGIAWWWILGRVADAFGRRRTDVFPWTTWLSLVVVYGIVSSITIVCARVAPEAIPRAVVVVAVFVAGCLTVEVIGRRRMVGRREIVISGVRNV